MVILLDPSQSVEFVLACDRELPAEQRTIFRLRPISARVGSQLAAPSEDKDPLQPMLTILRAGLVSWSGARDSNGTEVPFPVAAGDWERVPDLFTMRDLSDLVQAVLDVSRLGEVERKNSDSAQPS